MTPQQSYTHPPSPLYLQFQWRRRQGPAARRRRFGRRAGGPLAQVWPGQRGGGQQTAAVQGQEVWLWGAQAQDEAGGLQELERFLGLQPQEGQDLWWGPRRRRQGRCQEGREPPRQDGAAEDAWGRWREAQVRRRHSLCSACVGPTEKAEKRERACARPTTAKKPKSPNCCLCG